MYSGTHVPTLKQNLLSSSWMQAEVFPRYLECSTSTGNLTGCIYPYRKESVIKIYYNVILKFWGSVHIHWSITVSGISALRFNWKALNHIAKRFMFTGSHTFMWTTVLGIHYLNINFPLFYPTNNGGVWINTAWSHLNIKRWGNVLLGWSEYTHWSEHNSKCNSIWVWRCGIIFRTIQDLSLSLIFCIFKQW
jgi:hypothetical protein